jgi:hypothetical protein
VRVPSGFSIGSKSPPTCPALLTVTDPPFSAVEIAVNAAV